MFQGRFIFYSFFYSLRGHLANFHIWGTTFTETVSTNQAKRTTQGENICHNSSEEIRTELKHKIVMFLFYYIRTS
jgi:hypothetical protein